MGVRLTALCSTKNWLELTLRFLGPDHGIRGIKDQMTRNIIAGFEKQGIAIGAPRQQAVAALPDA